MNRFFLLLFLLVVGENMFGFSSAPKAVEYWRSMAVKKNLMTCFINNSCFKSPVDIKS